MDKGTKTAAPAKAGAASPKPGKKIAPATKPTPKATKAKATVTAKKPPAKKPTIDKALVISSVSVAPPKPEPLCKDKLCILGTADTLGMAPYDDDSFELWGVSPVVTYPVCKRTPDVLFEMHDESYWTDKNVLERLRNGSGEAPIFMQKKDKRIKRSVTYPLDDILQYGKYHTTAITYMLALAYHFYKTTGAPYLVSLFGVHMDAREEYTVQRPCVEHWIGKLQGAGVSVDLAPGGSLLASEGLYAYENYKAVCLRFKERAQALAMGEQHCNNQAREWQLKSAKQQGAKEENEYWLRRHQTGTEMDMIQTEQGPPMPQ